MPRITLKQLQKMFVGRRVMVTHNNKDFGKATGVCEKIFYYASGDRGSFNIQVGKVTYGLKPNLLTNDYVEGPLHNFSRTLRKISILKFSREEAKLIKEVKAAFPDEDGLYAALDANRKTAVKIMSRLSCIEMSAQEIARSITEKQYDEVLKKTDIAAKRYSLMLKWLQTFYPKTYDQFKCLELRELIIRLK